MTTIGYVLTGILSVLALVLSIIILMQSKRSAGLGAIGGGGGGGGDTYWSKNKGHSVEGALEKYTKIGGALFMIIAFVINLVG